MPILRCFIITTELKTRFPVLLTIFTLVKGNDDRSVLLKIVVRTEQVSRVNHENDACYSVRTNYDDGDNFISSLEDSD